jgi:P2-related tail formation protein
MALKKLKENPNITDTILLEIECPDSNGCFESNPYKVDNVIIYYIERDFLGENYGEYEELVISDKLKLNLEELQKKACDDPSPENLQKLTELQIEIQSSSQKNKIYYKDRSTIKVIGSEGYPAWIGTDIENSPLTLESTDVDGNVQYGHYSYEWNPQGSIREGDYFVCWTWTPLPAGEKLSAHIHFKIEGDGKAVKVLPSHNTAENKYETLLERYLPEMYKYTLADTDITPEVTEKFNLSVAKGFTFLEDMANQIIDLFDANALHESMLTYLSNTFAVKLKSDDPTLWRRQIKEAIPLFKKKGTYSGLEDAFSQAGMKLNAFTQYWQLVSPYTFIETFKVVDSPIFQLEKISLIQPIDPNNFELSLKRFDESSYTVVGSENVTFDDTAEDGIIRMTWIGDQLSAGGLSLYEGDRIKIMYQYKNIDTPTEQALENYIRLLPLQDLRDEDDQEYPPKNWNVRLIAEDDPLFDTLIPVRHPFADPIQFGWTRTEFAYSENIYNAEEYNGSTRPAFDPCKIDKNFLDPCGSCLSSSYSVDIGVEELSNDRMLEAQEILREYTPFHAQIHTLNFTGEVNEFIQSPVEQVDTLVTFDYVQTILSGSSNPFFYRNMEGAQTNWVITREDLTDQVTISTGNIGVAYNDYVSFISPDHNLRSLGVDAESHLLEILGPSANIGTYTITEIQSNRAKVSSSTVEPLDKTAFTFRLSNVPYGNSNSSITQSDLVELTDSELDFATIGVKTQWDVENTPDYTGGSWRVLIPAYSATPYEIKEIVENTLILDEDSNLPISSVTGVSYTLMDDLSNTIETSTDGSLTITRRALVNLNDPFIVDINEFVKTGDFCFYDSVEYQISQIEGNNFYILNYEDGNAIGVSLSIRRRLVQNGIGYFGYGGLHLITTTDHESDLGILNGNNPPSEDYVTDDSNFYQNYMFLIDDEYYKVASINGTDIVLEGREQDWMTINAGGTSVEYSIIHFPKKEVNVGFTVFDQLDHSGRAPVIRETYSTIDNNTAIVALSAPKSSGVQENVNQEEGISFMIETRNGETLEGEL